MKLTEVVFILDKSGSMAGLEKDTIGGFNSTIEKQKEGEGEVIVSTVLFDDSCQVLHDRVKIQEVEEMKRKDYWPGGCTALLDAIGESIRHIKNVHKYIREEDRPDNTIFIITTDGMENASRKYNIERIRKMISEMRERYKWEFISLGANIDAIGVARDYGIDEDFATNYIADENGTKANYCAMNEAICYMRKENKVNKNWKKGVEEDYNKRK